MFAKVKLKNGIVWVILVLVCVNCLDLVESQNGTELAQTNGKQKENISDKLKYNSTTKSVLNDKKPEITILTTYETKLSFPHNLEVVLEVLSKLQNEKCVEETSYALNALTRKERWSLEMFDSFPKFPVGILYGNYFQLGDFDECTGVKHSVEMENGTENELKGQYCLADIHFSYKRNNNGRTARDSDEQEFESEKNRYKFNNTVIHWGVCLPSSCNPEDAGVFVKEIFSKSAENLNISQVIVDENKCYVQNSEQLSSLEIVYGCVIGIFVLFVFFATGFHIRYTRKRKRCIAYNVEAIRPKENTLKDVVICFSLIQTVGKWLHTKPNELNLECICGIKFISMGFIIAGHSLIFLFGGPISNVIFFETMAQKVQNGFFLNNPLLVDTFLLTGGFLMCRMLLVELEKRKGKVNFLILYIARYIRLTPVYAVVLGLYVTWLVRLGDGPFWKSRIKTERDRCVHSWWTNLLYVNNYVNTDQLCMFQSWYLAVDYHLFIIAPFIIYPLYKWKRIGYGILGVGIIVTVIIPFLITYKNHLDATLFAYPTEISDLNHNYYFVNVYIKTHMRGSSYFIGIFFGYLVHKLQSSGAKIKRYIIWIGWILAAIFGNFAMFSIIYFYNKNYQYNRFEVAIYASLHRVAWCLSIGWVMLICITENSEVVNKFLSWKPFIPLSRLTYCAYLTNGFIEIYNIGTLRQPTHFSIFELMCNILGHFVLTFLSAFLLCIFFESPIHGLEKILLRAEKPREPRTNTNVIHRVTED